MTHSSLQAHRVTRSITNYSFNHIGGLAVSHYEPGQIPCSWAGFSARFPTLRFGFLEGGVAWAASLLAD